MALKITNKKILEQALFQFIFPFSIKEELYSTLPSLLKKQGFQPFNLGDLENENKYYGEYSISHKDIEQYFLPFTNNILFPHSENEKGFQRYSKVLDEACSLDNGLMDLPFTIHSLDITLSPYQLGFLTIRTKVLPGCELSEANEFANKFRILDPYYSKGTFIKLSNDVEQWEINDFIFHILCKGLTDFFDRSNMEGAYFESLPFFENEKMYVQSLIRFKEEDEFGELELYRAASLDGFNSFGAPHVSANNKTFIKKYLQDHCYGRWAPETQYVLGENCFACVTNEDSSLFRQLASQFYGQYYYGFLLNLFHKIVLLKLANDYSEIDIEKDHEKIEKLIHSINTFTSNYFFLELAAQSQGRQVFVHLRKMFLIDDLYRDARQTLFSLYKFQEKFSGNKNSFLLLILTLYTVVGGIYGMNQVIEDLKGNIEWNKLLQYSVFEYIALFITLSGLITTAYLGISNFLKWRKDKRNQDRWSTQTTLKNEKQAD